jgi:hypothetical protein
MSRSAGFFFVISHKTSICGVFYSELQPTRGLVRPYIYKYAAKLSGGCFAVNFYSVKGAILIL